MDVRDYDEQPRQLLATLEDAEFTGQLDRIRIVGGTAGNSDDLRFQCLRLQDERGKVRSRKWMTHRTEDFSAICADDLRRLLLERMSKGVIGSEEKPGVAAALDDFLRSPDCQRTRIEYPLHRIRRAEFAMKIRRSGRVHNQHLLLFLGHVLHGQSDG